MPAETLIIVPTYNERENLPELVRRLDSLPVPVDLLIVDDNSPDGTGQIADELASKNPWVHVLHRTVKDGLGRAYVAGFQWALSRDYRFIFEMDADFSHNPSDIPAFSKRPRNRRPIWCWAHATRAAFASSIGRCPDCCSPSGAASTLESSPACPSATQPGLQMLSTGDVGGHRCQFSHSQWLQFPNRTDPSHLASGSQDRRGSHHLHRSGAGCLKDVTRHRH